MELVPPVPALVSCGHCGKAAEARYRCAECDGLPLCAACAREAGLLGMEKVMADRAARAWRERAEQLRRRIEERGEG
jgi:hypothetical protein